MRHQILRWLPFGTFLILDLTNNAFKMLLLWAPTRFWNRTKSAKLNSHFPTLAFSHPSLALSHSICAHKVVFPIFAKHLAEMLNPLISQPFTFCPVLPKPLVAFHSQIRENIWRSILNSPPPPSPSSLFLDTCVELQALPQSLQADTALLL